VPSAILPPPPSSQQAGSRSGCIIGPRPSGLLRRASARYALSDAHKQPCARPAFTTSITNYINCLETQVIAVGYHIHARSTGAHPSALPPQNWPAGKWPPSSAFMQRRLADMANKHPLPSFVSLLICVLAPFLPTHDSLRHAVLSSCPSVSSTPPPAPKNACQRLQKHGRSEEYQILINAAGRAPRAAPAHPGLLEGGILFAV